MRRNRKDTQPYTFKRQWGAERRLSPLSVTHSKPSTRKIAFSRLAIVLTVLFWMVYIISVVIRQFFDGPHTFQFTMQAIGYVVVVTFLTFSALMYLMARQGALQRFSAHVRIPRAELDRHFSKSQPSITVLVPSYSEEPQVIRKTLLSAALQEYPNIRVVLLLDDKPNPTKADDIARLADTRALADEISNTLAEPRKRFLTALTAFENRYHQKDHVAVKDTQKLAEEYAWAAQWLNNFANNEQIEDHVDVFFAEQVLRKLANELQLVSDALVASCQESALLPTTRILQLYRRLAWTFNAELAIFERKKYASLSHEANKAMNLNSYIGLMGGMYREEQTPDGPVLLPAETKRAATLTLPDSDFILTLDADSILLGEYCLRLVYFLQQPGNERVAVTQTPYSSFRGARTRIERLAGATTDIQHILHQGMTYYDATF
ncbi:MAG TPA: glycosyltransferase family 2 protein, partial [Candidatus Saccharimonadales bacterium]